tara:strand:+ start:284 stop:1900 length:1617 start_codon:yes stop_codon:yes gene_type:complete
MKKLKNLIGLITILFLASCSSDSSATNDNNVDNTIVPTNLQVSTAIVGADSSNPYGDGSGIVQITATADNAITYQFVNNGVISAAPTGTKTYTFLNSGNKVYSITAIAISSDNKSISETVDIEVYYNYTPSVELISILTDNASKEWRIKFESSGHFGFGDANSTTPNLWSANPYEKEDSGAYDDRFVFNTNGAFTDTTNDNILGKSVPMTSDLGGSQGLTANSDGEFENYLYPNYSETWSLSLVEGKETITFSNSGFLGYYTGGSHDYTIISRTDNELKVSTIDYNGLKWFGILTTDAVPDVNQGPENSIYSILVWSDEFDVDGAPDASNWTYDLGAGGWGNNELQTYTNSTENAIVEDGVLKIIAKTNGSGYTSARLKSQGLRAFTYGRIEVRAKLPASTGTWPAIWMLGSNFSSVGWPNSGEMDIMEQKGWEKNKVLGTFHWQDSASNSYAGYGLETTASTSTTEFHLYSLEWTPSVIYVLYDDVPYVTFANNGNLPFNADFFFILNIAMGGNLGGTVDTNFTQDTMEVDYVRIYQ